MLYPKPTGQFLQIDDPSSDIVPVRHISQVVLPAGEYVLASQIISIFPVFSEFSIHLYPALHGMQLVFLGSLVCPGGQRVQTPSTDIDPYSHDAH